MDIKKVLVFLEALMCGLHVKINRRTIGLNQGKFHMYGKTLDDKPVAILLKQDFQTIITEINKASDEEYHNVDEALAKFHESSIF